MTDDASMDIGRPSVDENMEQQDIPQTAKPLVLEIAQLNDALDNEMHQWQLAAIHPTGVSADPVKVDSMLSALIDLFVPVGQRLEYEKAWKERYLMQLMALRRNIQQQQTQQAIVQGIVGADGKPVDVKK